MGQRVQAASLDAHAPRLGDILRRGYLRRQETPVALTAAAGAVLVMLLIHWAAVSAAEGTQGPVHHLAYPAILLAAYLFGLKGALVVTIVPILVSGPLPVLVMTPTTWAWDGGALLRAVIFLTVAIVTGILFDHLRTALDGWRTTAVRVAEREREGMIALARGAEAKDTDTGDHILRVQRISERLALATGMADGDAEALGWAAMLHDIGKLRVPDHILTKPGPLTADEQAIVRLHTVWGERILADGDAYGIARRVVRWHHENFDGSGYPDGLRHDRIPLEARIVRVADAFDAMTHGRRYQPARDLGWAADELLRCSGQQFDPDLVRVFVDVLEADPSFARAILPIPIGGEVLTPVPRALAPAGVDRRP